MNLRFVANLSLILSVFCFASISHGYGRYGSSSSAFGVEARYDSIQRMDVGMVALAFPFSPSNDYALDGNLQGQRATLSLFYKAGDLKFTATGGAALNGKFNASNTNVSTLETMNFDTSIVYGAGLAWEVLGESPFHIRPTFSYLHTGFKGTKGSLSTGGGACTYDFTSGAAATAGCSTLGGLSLSNGITYGVRNDFKEDVFSAGLELAIDLGGFVTLFGGAQETYSTLSGTSTVTATAVTQPSSIESLNFANSTHEGIYAGLSFDLGGALRVTGKYSMLSEQTVSGALSVGF